MSQEKYAKRTGRINSLSSQVKKVCAGAQFAGGVFISNPQERAENMVAAANDAPMFENFSDDEKKGIVTAWGSAIKTHQDTYGEMPRDEVLASAAQSMLNISAEGISATCGASNMFESVSTLATTEGTPVRAKNAGLILPTTLMAATADMATFVPADSEEIEIFEMQRVTASNFGDYKAGEKLDNFNIGQYGNMLQTFACPAPKAPNGTKTEFVFDTNTDTEVKAPIKPHSAVIYLNSIPVAECNGKGVLVSLTSNITVTGSVDLTNGVITANFATAPADGANLAFEFEVDVEKAPQLIPKINMGITSEIMRPSDSIIGNDYTVQSFYKANREFGIDLGSQLMASSRNTLAHEKDTLNIMKATMAAHHDEVVPFNLTLKANHTWRDQYETLLEKLNALSTSMLTETTTSGIRGIFCGSDAINIIKTLAGSLFKFAPNYTEKPYIHFVGMLGRYRIYHVPMGFKFGGCEFTSWDMLCYGRGDNHSEAGLVNGDAVSPVSIPQGTLGTTKANVIWTRRYQRLHPNSGFKYFRMMRMNPAA